MENYYFGMRFSNILSFSLLFFQFWCQLGFLFRTKIGPRRASAGNGPLRRAIRFSELRSCGANLRLAELKARARTPTPAPRQRHVSATPAPRQRHVRVGGRGGGPCWPPFGSPRGSKTPQDASKIDCWWILGTKLGGKIEPRSIQKCIEKTFKKNEGLQDGLRSPLGAVLGPNMARRLCRRPPAWAWRGVGAGVRALALELRSIPRTAALRGLRFEKPNEDTKNRFKINQKSLKMDLGDI